MNARAIRVAVVCDYPEEGWASMDLVAEMIVDHLAASTPSAIAVARVCPPFRTRLSAWPVVGRKPGLPRVTSTASWNRFGDYPRAPCRIAACQGKFDLYHLADHSYSASSSTPSRRSGRSSPATTSIPSPACSSPSPILAPPGSAR